MGNNNKFVVVRGEKTGVFFGYLRKVKCVGDAYDVTVENIRRVYYFNNANSVMEIAAVGDNSSSSQITAPVPVMQVIVHEIYYCSKEVEDSLNSIALWVATKTKTPEEIKEITNKALDFLKDV